MEASFLETNPFQRCLIDALHYFCFAHERPEEQKEYSRTSILSSCLAIEALSNCCLETLDFEGKLQHEFDRLPPLAKFDLFLVTRNQQPLNRGDFNVQIAKKLISLRNDFVHPRYQKRAFRPKDAEIPGLDIKMDETLGKRKGTDDLLKADAKSVCTKLNGFLQYFVQAARLSNEERLAIFSERVIFDCGKVQYQGGWSFEAVRAVKYLGLDMSWHPWYRDE